MDPGRFGRQQDWDNTSVIVVFSTLDIRDDKQEFFIGMLCLSILRAPHLRTERDSGN